MKKITFTLALITLTAMAAFASGNAEDNTMPWTQGQGQYQSDVVLSEETTTVTGIVNMVEDGHVELIVGNDTFELVYPYRLSNAADLQDGMEITVEGFEAEGLRLNNDATTKNLVLKSATIDGETYKLDDVSNDFGGYGQRGSQQNATMGQRGRMSDQKGGSFGNIFSGRGRS
ncbi:MAG: hypothetical protein PF693_06980 [Spirochaetia bacterium]|jgi:hypothetical protein|nr:hypothetical protein [Spirochaetia bacterium]